MSDHIAHIAICDDVFRLAAIHPAIQPHFKALMASHRGDAHLGSVTRFADHFSADIVDYARRAAKRTGDDIDPIADRKLAFVLGSLTHRSADRLMKPITRCWGSGEDSGFGNANESKIYQDVFALREVFSGGEGELAGPFAGVLNQPTTSAEATLEAYMRILWTRGLIGMHTLRPDRENVHEWMAALFENLQTFPKSLAQYAQIAAEWDAEKVRRYLVEKNFYNRDEAIILTARKLQRGFSVSVDELYAAIDLVGPADTSRASRWSRALAKALDYLIAAGELFRGDIELDEARQRFDIGVPELSLQE